MNRQCWWQRLLLVFLILILILVTYFFSTCFLVFPASFRCFIWPSPSSRDWRASAETPRLGLRRLVGRRVAHKAPLWLMGMREAAGKGSAGEGRQESWATDGDAQTREHGLHESMVCGLQVTGPKIDIQQCQFLTYQNFKTFNYSTKKDNKKHG